MHARSGIQRWTDSYLSQAKMSTAFVSISSDIMGGSPVFPGTRVPVEALLVNIEAGGTIDEFLIGYPSVTREHVVAFLKRAVILAIQEAA
jgi:uncharacterized protein (DUF433 family)